MALATTGGGSASGLGSSRVRNPFLPANGWWLVQEANGNISLTKGSPPGNAIKTSFLGTANSLLDFLSSPTGGTTLSNALAAIGATPNQAAAMATEVDAGAGKNPNLTFLTIGNVTPGSNAAAAGGTQGPISTAPSGDVASAGINLPTGNVLGDIWQWLTTASNWVRILEYVGGAVLVYLGIKGLTGIGPDASDVAGVAAKVVK